MMEIIWEGERGEKTHSATGDHNDSGNESLSRGFRSNALES